MSTFFIISIFGIIFGWRTEIYFEKWVLSSDLKKERLALITTLKLLLLVVAPIFLNSHRLIFSTVTFFSLIPSLTYYLGYRQLVNRKKFIEDGFAVDLLLISIKSGKSLREALSDLKTKLADGGQHTSVQMGLHCEALAKSSDRIIERLKALKFKIEIERKLRHKSRQALLQTRIQAWLVLFLYLLLVLLIEDYRKNPLSHPALVISALFVAAGVFWIQKMGKNIKWKV